MNLTNAHCAPQQPERYFIHLGPSQRPNPHALRPVPASLARRLMIRFAALTATALWLVWAPVAHALVEPASTSRLTGIALSGSAQRATDTNTLGQIVPKLEAFAAQQKKRCADPEVLLWNQTGSSGEDLHKTIAGQLKKAGYTYQEQNIQEGITALMAERNSQQIAGFWMASGDLHLLAWCRLEAGNMNSQTKPSDDVLDRISSSPIPDSVAGATAPAARERLEGVTYRAPAGWKAMDRGTNARLFMAPAGETDKNAQALILLLAGPKITGASDAQFRVAFEQGVKMATQGKRIAQSSKVQQVRINEGCNALVQVVVAQDEAGSKLFGQFVALNSGGRFTLLGYAATTQELFQKHQPVMQQFLKDIEVADTGGAAEAAAPAPMMDVTAPAEIP